MVRGTVLFVLASLILAMAAFSQGPAQPALAVVAATQPPAVQKFWQACTARLEPAPDGDSYRVRIFGRDERTADLLLGLIRAGEKTVTFTSPWIYAGDPMATPVEGGYTVVTNFAGEPGLVLRTTAVYTKPFNEVTEADSQYEGPAARPLEAWRRIHWDFFGDVLAPAGREPTETMPVTVERFEVVCDRQQLKPER